MAEVTLLGALLVSVGGGLGAVLRLILDSWVTRASARRSGAAGVRAAGAGAGAGTSRSTAVFPWGITAVNLSGSFALGLLVGALVAFQGVPEGSALTPLTPEMLANPGYGSHPAWLALGVGLLGGFTTLSTASLDTVRLARAGRFAAASANALGTLGAAVLLAVLGMQLGRWIF